MRDFSGELSDYCEMVGLESDAISETDLKNDQEEPFYTKPWFLFLLTLAAGGAISQIAKMFK